MGMQSEIHWQGIGQGFMGMHPEIHWQGDRNSWECSLEFIGREIGT